MNDLISSISKLNNGNKEEIPPGLTEEEWKNHLELELDDLTHLELIKCNKCKDYHKVEIK